jgi:hypothetical protein
VLKDAENWKDNSIRLGIFGYYGENPSMVNSEIEKFSRIGFDVDCWYGNLNLFGGAWFGKNNGPFTLEEQIYPAEFKSYTFFVQADYVIYPWLIGSLRWEKFQADRLSVWRQQGFEQVHGFLVEDDITRFVPHISLLFRANVKLVLEAALFPSGEWKKNSRFGLTLAVAL